MDITVGDLSELSVDERLAFMLADADAQLLRELVERRESLGMTQDDVADRLGLTQATISAFERYDNDPKLSTIRRYALAVGACIQHSVFNPSHILTDKSTWNGAGEFTFRPVAVPPLHQNPKWSQTIEAA